MKLWLDDVRPAPEGWTHVRTVKQAKDAVLLASSDIEEMSLDHDLGICDRCTPGSVHGNIVVVASLEAVCQVDKCDCDCHETGYDFVEWLAAEDLWSRKKPRVHSQNPVGAANMKATIDRHWHDPDEDPDGQER